MSYIVGSPVVVLTLGRKRGVVVEVGRGGHYRVQVENAIVSCREDDLAPPPEDRGKKRGTPKRHDAPAVSVDEPAPAGRLDLHGLTVEEAIARVVQEIDQALRRGADRVEMIHGKGSGRIREALHRYLATMPAVSAFNLDPRNAGVTWVYF